LFFLLIEIQKPLVIQGFEKRLEHALELQLLVYTFTLKFGIQINWINGSGGSHTTAQSVFSSLSLNFNIVISVFIPKKKKELSFGLLSCS
jgi:hypothetical protein